MKYYIILCLTIVSTLFSIAGHDAHALTFTATQSGDWNDPATWGGSVPSSTDDKIIPFGVYVTTSDNVDNAGTITDNAIIKIASGITINNTGTIKVTGDNGTILNSGIIQNYGTIINDVNRYVANNFGAVLNNHSHHTTSNYGTIVNRGTITNFQLSEIDNFGTIDNANLIQNKGGNLTNTGTINDICKSVFSNSVHLTGNEVIKVPCPSIAITLSPSDSVLPGTEVDLHAHMLSSFGWQNLWSLSAPSGSTSSLAGTAGDFTYFVPDIPGVYKVTSTITDDLGNVASASIQVHVKNS